MAVLKDSLITGDLRVTGTIYGDVPLNDLVDADDLKAIEALSGTSGLLKKTAANTWTLDTNAYTTSSGVTSVRVQATSPVVSSVNTAQTSTLNTTISLADGYGDTKNPYASKTARYVLAAPASAAGVPTFRALTNADVGLGNVENTKLSTWTGSSNITTIGTLSSGTVPWARLSGVPSSFTPATHNHDSVYVNVTGDTMTGYLTVSNSGSAKVQTKDTGSTGEMFMGFGSGHQNHGIYSYGYAPTASTWTSSEKWMVYRDGSGNVILNGNATSATGFASAKTIALTGNVTGSATGGNGSNGWSIATTIGSGVVTNAMLAGSIANGKLVNSKVTIAGNDVSLGGSLAAATLKTSLGLNSAMHYIGKATVAITDGSTTDPKIGGNATTLVSGDVIIDSSDSREYVWNGSAWELLGGDSSYKVTQTAVTDAAYSGSDTATTFVSAVTQNANGEITVTKRKLPTYNNYSHPTGDGNKHVPANGTSNNGKFLQATATAGTYQWASLPTASTTGAGIIQIGTAATNAAAGNHTHTFASLTSKPTTLSGYGITDGLGWQVTTSKSTELYDFGFYVNRNNAAGTGPAGSNYFSIFNLPYSNAAGNPKAYWGWQLGGNTDNNSRLWFRTTGDNVFGSWQEIAHAPQGSNNIGSATQPVYMTSAGVITAGTALKALAYKDSLTASDVGAATSGHTHATSIAASSGTNQITLALGTKYAITAGGTSYVFTMPANPNTDIKQNITLKTTTKGYITAVETAPTGTAAAQAGIADTGVYLTTTAGQINATSYKINEKSYMSYDTTVDAIGFTFV